jgi:hypothetical protein
MPHTSFRQGRPKRSLRFLAVAVLVLVAVAAWTPAVRLWLQESSWWRQFGRATLLLLAAASLGVAAWRRPLPLLGVGAVFLLLFTWKSVLFWPVVVLCLGGAVALGFWAKEACHEALPRKYRERRGLVRHVHGELKKARQGMERLKERAHMLEPEVVEREVAMHLGERRHAEVMSAQRREPAPWPEVDGPDGDRIKFLADHMPESMALAFARFQEWQAHPELMPVFGEPTSYADVAADRATAMRLLEPIAATWEARLAEIERLTVSQFDQDHLIERELRAQWSAGKDVIAAAQEKESRHTRELKLEEEELVAAIRQDPGPPELRLVWLWLVSERRTHPGARPARQA